MIYEKLFKLKQTAISLTRDSEGHNYKYADLEQIQDKLAPILEELKLLVLHRGEGNKIYTMIYDTEDKTFVESFLDIGKVETTRTEEFEKNSKKTTTIEYNELDPQGVGSILTYYRRYNLLMLLDLKTEDTDASNVSGRAKNKVDYSEEEVYVMTKNDVDNLWNGKIYGSYVYLDEKEIKDIRGTNYQIKGSYKI